LELLLLLLFLYVKPLLTALDETFLPSFNPLPLHLLLLLILGWLKRPPL
jgi:hypothetical protein